MYIKNSPVKVLWALYALVVFLIPVFGAETPVLFVEKGHTDPVGNIAYSPDGNYIASYSPNNIGNVSVVKVWDVRSGRELRTFFTHIAGPTFMNFSPDGSIVELLGKQGSLCEDSSGISDGTGVIEVLYVFTGDTKLLKIMYGDGPSAAAISADNRIVSVINNNTFFPAEEIKSFDIATGTELGPKISDGINIMHSLSPESRFYLRYDNVNDRYAGLLTGSKNIFYWLSNIADGTKIKKVYLNTDSIGYNAAFSPNGSFAAWAYVDSVRLLNLNEGTTKTYATAEKKAAVDISPDGAYFLTYLPPDNYHNTPNTIRIYDVASGRTIQTIQGSFNSAVFFSDGNTVLTCDNDGNVCRYDIASGRKVQVFGGTKPCPQKSLVEYFNRYMITLSPFSEANSHWYVWDLQNAGFIKIIPNTSSTIQELLSYIDTSSLDQTSGKPMIKVCIGATSTDSNFTSSFSDSAQAVKIYRRNDKKEIAQCIMFDDGEWIVMTPEGYFNASPNGAKHINVRVGSAVYSIDNFYEKFYNPVYVASVLQEKMVVAAADIRKGIQAPPEVKIISPEPGKDCTSDTVTITVLAKDMGGGIDEIRLYQNGKVIGEDTRGLKVLPKGNEQVRTFTVTLVDGANTFRATAFSKDRTESNPCEQVVHLSAPQKDVSMHILAAGINIYKNHALNLNYAQPDAQGIADFFRQDGSELFKTIAISERYNEHATKDSIIAGLLQLQNTNPQDVVLIYLAGHGENINDKWYFIPYELTYPENENDVKTKAISSDELKDYITKIKAQKILMLIDACKSGAVLVAFRGFEDRKALAQLSRSTGMYVVAASAKDQYAAEGKELGHGVFTYTLLEGLKGKAALQGEPVTVLKLLAYIQEQLPILTKKYNQEEQYPVMGSSQGMDFPLVIIK